MKYEEALEQIHARLRFGNKLTLSRIRELLHLLGDPQASLSVIHVAGTNGKGSVSKYIYYALMRQGYSVGLYTSPYVVDFRERIECDGVWISREALAECTRRVLEAAASMERDGGDPPTEFEVVMAIAFLFYKECGCDYVVLEVGLGGRGDATNVVEAPLVSVITSISYDHMEYLGETLPKIAAEKAGIIKAGRPVVCRVNDPEALEVIREKARVCGSPFHDVLEEVSNVRVWESSLSGSLFSMHVMGEAYEEARVSLAGAYQIDNAATALCALEVLRREGGVPLEKRAILQGLEAAVHAARLEKISDDPLVIIDGAHNAEGMEAFCRSIKPFIQGKRALLTLGILKDKEVEKMLKSALSLGVDLALSEPENPRKASAEELDRVLGSLGGRAVVSGDAAHAWAYALDRRKDYDCLLFAGSLYFVSVIRAHCLAKKGNAMKARYEETMDTDLLMDIFVRNDIEVADDEFTGDHTRLLKAFAVYDDEAEGRLAGAVALASRMGRTIINGIAVDPQYRRTGVASGLLERVMAEAARRNTDVIWIVARAPLFFEARGFEYITPDQVPEGLFDCLGCPQYNKVCFPKLMKYVFPR